MENTLYYSVQEIVAVNIVTKIVPPVVYLSV
jgi:hypothetical protein